MIMEEQEKKSINHFVRSLHRDIGFSVIGLTIIYSISGIVLLIGIQTSWKHETLIEKTLSPNMEASELGKVLHLRDLKVLKAKETLNIFKCDI